MPVGWHFTRVDTVEIKSQIEKRIGRLKAEKYFDLLTKFLSCKINKCEFDRLCIGVIGRENVRIHNHFLRSIIKNALLSKVPPPTESKVQGVLGLKVPNGYQKSSLQSLCREFPQSPRRGRMLSDRKFRDRPSPLGPHGKGHGTACENSVPKNQEQQSATELLSFGSRPPGSVEDGEEVDQAAGSPSIYSRSPVTAPLGIPLISKGSRKVLFNHLESSYNAETCHNIGELPDSTSLRNRLEHKLAKEGVNISLDCANLLNNSLDLYLRRMIKPCLDLAGSKTADKHVGKDHGRAMNGLGLNGMWPARYAQMPSMPVSASMLDFRVAMELNPSVLGEEWPAQFERICLRASEE